MVNYSVIDHENGLRELVRTTSLNGRIAYSHARFGGGILCIKRQIFEGGRDPSQILDCYQKGERGFDDSDKLLGGI